MLSRKAGFLGRRGIKQAFATTSGKSSQRRYQSSISTSTNSSSTTTTTSQRKTALVMGSSGALGSSVTHHLQQTLGMRVLGADVMELPTDLAGDAFELDGFIELPKDASLSELSVELVRGVDYCLRELQDYEQIIISKDDDDSSTSIISMGLDAIICANGGWQGDPPVPQHAGGTSETLNEKDEWQHRIETGSLEYANTITNMMQMNLNPCLAAAYVAQHYSNSASLMVVVGATAALSPTPGMLGYGLAKAASHHLVRTVGACTGNSLESKSLRKAGRSVRKHLPALDDLTIVGLLPTMIDTEANRQSNPDADFDQWTQPACLSREIGTWIQQPALRPHSGSLVKVYRKQGESAATFELAR